MPRLANPIEAYIVRVIRRDEQRCHERLEAWRKATFHMEGGAVLIDPDYDEAKYGPHPHYTISSPDD
jgi:hypothetical protein